MASSFARVGSPGSEAARRGERDDSKKSRIPCEMGFITTEGSGKGRGGKGSSTPCASYEPIEDFAGVGFFTFTGGCFFNNSAIVGASLHLPGAIVYVFFPLLPGHWLPNSECRVYREPCRAAEDGEQAVRRGRGAVRVLRGACIVITASRRRRMGGSKPAALEVSGRVVIAHCSIEARLGRRN